tara:strand:- start:1118 stop:2458 length:1341 start_codon:yes stop_codon:yes gene_type:complete
MIYFSNASQAVSDSIQMLKSINQDVTFARRDMAIEYYTYGNTSKYIQDFFGGSLQKELPIYTQNMTKRLINRKSLVYKNAPIRNFETDFVGYEDMIAKKNWKLKSFERVHNLVGTLPVMICWKDDHFTYQPIINFAPIFNPENPLEPMAITYLLNKMPEDVAYVEEDVYVYWSKTEHFLFDGEGRKYAPNEDNPEMINPYGILPFVFLQPNNMVDEFWNEGGMDIVDANRQIDLSMTMLQHHIRSAGGQVYIEGRVDDTEIELGLNKILAVEDGKVGSINPGVNIQSIIEGIKFQLLHIFQNHHITFDYGLSGSKSGVALKIENMELLESREDDVEKYRMIEKEIYEVEKAIAVYNGFVLPEMMTVDFAEIDFPDPEKEMEQWEWKWKHGLADKIDYLMEQDADRFQSREEAEDYLAERKSSSTNVKMKADQPENIFNINAGTEEN